MGEINFSKIEKKWQKRWAEKKVFAVSENSKKKKFYVLEMFPYPSAAFLHMGHVRNFTIGDIYARFKRMQGFNVLYPMGFDSFGLPAENAAKKEGISPKVYTKNSIAKIKEYFTALGNSYDWSRMISTCESDYYKWNQYFFIKFYEKGLVYRKKAPVNWCPKCESVLANEESEGGKCWRCGTEVVSKELEQWFLKTTAYADELLDGLDKINWFERIKTMQRNWIGKSSGTEIDFEIETPSEISNVVLVHGSNDNEKEGLEFPRENQRHWFPWIKDELEKQGINVSHELYPMDWSPNYEKWKKVFEKNKINKNSILIGHSAGAGFLVRWLEETKRKIKKLILVAPYVVHDGEADWLKEFVNFKFDKSLKNYYDELIIFYDKKDMKGILQNVSIIKKILGGKVIDVKNHGHFTEEDTGTKEFPELLNEIETKSKTNYILLHGYTGTPEGGFRTWLKNELEKRGNEVHVPRLPNTNNPNIPEQISYVLKNHTFNEDTILLGHSLGSVIALKVVEQLKKPIRKLILVAGPIKHNKPSTLRAFEKTFDGKFDFEKIKENAKEIIILRAKNDSVVSSESADYFSRELSARIVDFIAEADHVRGEVEPEVLNSCLDKWPIFTTRPDTIFGVTFMVVSAQHPRLMGLVTDKQKKEVEAFLKKINSGENAEVLEKEGAFTGSYAVNPMTNEKIPVYVGNFVVADYGCGMVMAVPAHDQRDFEFAKKYGIEIKRVIEGKEQGEVIAVEAILKTKDGKFLFQERDGDTKIYPNMVGLFGGAVEKGETGLDAIKRELKEELNLDLNDCQINFIGNTSSLQKGKLHSVFYVTGIEKKFLELNEGKSILEFTLENFLKNKNITPFAKNAINCFKTSKERAFTGGGELINSGKFNGLDNDKAKEEITKELSKKKLGRKTVKYKLRDWLISRQRYWGTPIPMVYCDKCGVVAVKEKDLPVKLPEDVKFGGKKNPLLSSKKFLDVRCPKCGGKAKRDTDTMGGFFDSSWYFLRFCSPNEKNKPFDAKAVNYWMPVDQYVGGAEHAVMHLIYARFFTKVLRDLGFVKIDEPFTNLFNQGIVYKDGAKMSKSKGNVVYQTEISDKYGIDTARLFLMAIASPEKQMEWSDDGVQGSYKFIRKVLEYFENVKIRKSDALTESRLNRTIKEVTGQIENFQYNLAIIRIRELFDFLPSETSRDVLEKSLKLLGPFCPHITEELWEKLGNKGFISLADWPKCDEKKIDEKLEQQEKSVEKVAEDVRNILKILEQRGETGKSLVKIYAIPSEIEIYENAKGKIESSVGLKVEVLNIKDAKSEGKKINAKPGKPGLIVG